jgi:hypothetical protein
LAAAAVLARSAPRGLISHKKCKRLFCWKPLVPLIYDYEKQHFLCTDLLPPLPPLLSI